MSVRRSIGWVMNDVTDCCSCNARNALAVMSTRTVDHSDVQLLREREREIIDMCTQYDGKLTKDMRSWAQKKRRVKQNGLTA